MHLILSAKKLSVNVLAHNKVKYSTLYHFSMNHYSKKEACCRHRSAVLHRLIHKPDIAITTHFIYEKKLQNVSKAHAFARNCLLISLDCWLKSRARTAADATRWEKMWATRMQIVVELKLFFCDFPHFHSLSIHSSAINWDHICAMH